MSIKLTGNGLYESSRMMLPEHQERLVQQKQEQAYDGWAAVYKQRPTRSEMEWEELGEQLLEAHQQQTVVTLLVCGRLEPLTGTVVMLDGRKRQAHVAYEAGVVRVPFEDVARVR